MSLNNYKSLGIIYGNSYGQVEKVKNIENGSIFLMKKMSKKYLKYKTEEETLNEIKKLSSIKHKNLSEYKTCFFDENSLYIIMEYDEESEIKEKVNYNIQNRLSFEENYLWSLTIQLLNLCKFIQNNKTLEFNLTSYNILLMNNGLLKIYDYGKNYLKLPFNEDSWIIDINIMPPELMEENNNCDRNAINIWKVGCIIYELCTLKPPFNGRNMNEIVKNAIDGKIKLIGDKYSNDFNILISKMLVVDPKKRATVDDLLNDEIIKRRNVEEKEDTNINIYDSVFSFKKVSIRESKRQKQSINEMMENDKYEIMKSTLSKNGLINDLDLDNIDIKATAHFNMDYSDDNNNNLENNNNNIDEINKNNSDELNYNNNFYNNIIKNEFRNNDSFKERIIEAQNKKRIIENNDFNYNNPHRNKNINNNNINNNLDNNINNYNINNNINNNMNNNIINYNINNNNINNNVNNKNNNINNNRRENNNVPKINKNLRNKNNNINNFNKKIVIENRNKLKNNIENELLNHIKKERQKTPILNKKNNIFGELLDNKKNMNNFIINDKSNEIKENKKIFLKCAKNNNNNKINVNGNNINTIKSYNGPKPNNINIKSNNELKEKTENILNFLKSNKKEEKKIKLKAGTEKKPPNNILDKKNKYPIISQMPKLPTESKADKMINQLLHKNRYNNLQNKIINNNKDTNFNFNHGNERKNNNNQFMNNNYLMKRPPVVKPANNLPNITYGKNNQIKIEYGVVKYKSTKNKIKRK